MVDKLRVKLGSERVFRIVPVESELPERASKRVPAMAAAKDANWPEDLPRPSRLLTSPELVNALAEIPDAPPRFFIWRKVRHRIAKADGPERIFGEWWLSGDEETSRSATITGLRICKASASGCFAMRRPIREAVGGCMGSVKLEVPSCDDAALCSGTFAARTSLPNVTGAVTLSASCVTVPSRAL